MFDLQVENRVKRYENVARDPLKNGGIMYVQRGKNIVKMKSCTPVPFKTLYI